MNPTFRQLFKRHLPEPYLSQAVANTENLRPGRIDNPEQSSHFPPDNLWRLITSAFPWDQAPEGWRYWSAASRGEFQTPALHLEVGKRYLTRDGRVAGPPTSSDKGSLEAGYPFSGPVEGQSIPYTWRSDGVWVDELEERHLDLVSEIVEEPATHRLLEPGETILAGDEYELDDDPDGSNWSPVRGAIGRSFSRARYKVTRRPLTATPTEDEVEAPTPTPEARLDVLESRIAVLEGLVIDPAVPVCDVVAPPEPKPLVLRVGGRYKTRDGGEAVIGSISDIPTEWPFRGTVSPCYGGDDGYRSWRPDGSQGFSRSSESPTDLVSEIVDEPEPERYPTTPLPEGYDRWVCRGAAWNPGRAAVYSVCGGPDEWGNMTHRGTPAGSRVLEYWEAVKDTTLAPPTYRLLNRGEIIREGDEALVQHGDEYNKLDLWLPSSSVGCTYSPADILTTRRPLKTYADA